MCVEQRQHFLARTSLTFRLGRGQAGARERSQENTHAFLLRGALKVAGKWDPAGLSPPTQGTPKVSPGLLE